MIYVKWESNVLSFDLIYLIHIKWFIRWHRLNEFIFKKNKFDMYNFINEDCNWYKKYYLENTIPWLEKNKRYYIDTNDYISISEFNIEYNIIIEKLKKCFSLIKVDHYYSPFSNIWEVLKDVYYYFKVIKNKYILSKSYNEYHIKAIYISDFYLSVNENFEFNFEIFYWYKNDPWWSIDFESKEKKIDLALIKFFYFLKNILCEDEND
jgi:hypothetical protein